MQPLTCQDLLRVWDQGRERHPVERALLLIAASCPNLSRGQLAALTAGQRDALLLSLRERTLGSELQLYTECPECAEKLELGLSTEQLRYRTAPMDKDGAPLATAAQELFTQGYKLRFRLPESRDLIRVARCGKPREAYGLLLESCVISAEHDGRAVSAAELPIEVREQLAKAMVAQDPQSEVLMLWHCPACQHEWEDLFEISTFFWTELHDQVRRLLSEIHTLALAYGWREADILAMSAWRRQSYLEMIGA